MRGGMIAAGVILLILSFIFFLIPQPGASTVVGVENDGETTTSRAFFALDIPPALTWALFIAGLLLFILGLALPASVVTDRERIVVDREPTVERRTTTVHERR